MGSNTIGQIWGKKKKRYFFKRNFGNGNAMVYCVFYSRKILPLISLHQKKSRKDFVSELDTRLLPL